MSTGPFISAIIHPPFASAVLLQLMNDPQPGNAQNYYVYCKLLEPDKGRSFYCLAEISESGEWKRYITASDAMKIFDMLSQSRIPPKIKEGNMMLDGSSYELFFGDHWGGAHYRWANGAPEGWEPLAQVIGVLERHSGVDIM